MGNHFGKLLLNENMKVFRRVRTWVMLAILALISILIPVLMREGLGSSEVVYWQPADTAVRVSFFLNTIFCVVIAAESVAGEFTWGTIKLLLIRPWSRSKILASKYLTVVGFSIMSTLLVIGMAMLTSYILFSHDAPLGNGLTAANAFTMWGYLYIDLFITLAIAFMVSSVFRSGALAIGLSLFIMFTQNIFSLIFNPDRYAWAKYVLFNNMDLSKYMHTSSDMGLLNGPSDGMTLGFSLAVLAVYYVIFMVISWVVFSKRDVAG
ncbi:ABC transporter permease [Paenibacillus barcinonensis]|uniref:ABC transporter permease n=2 Tax=Paenibacillus barcinonensis TaxID=198119 RepID=A0A2V4WAR8_PAEBA|nr:ABC transporter permease [Paenibacillus barcinonensis]PYE48438.1 ABC-2 type transport system permease protein [Paenibacillus barcinonensis]QKS58851.1 ABC transporter permease [Paenibacillus barcinonensis]